MFLDDPIRCCEVNCTEIGSKEKCPQACKDYDRKEICGTNKSCSIEREFQTIACPTKCFNIMEDILCKYPSCDKTTDFGMECPITCEKEPFPSMIEYCNRF